MMILAEVTSSTGHSRLLIVAILDVAVAQMRQLRKDFHGLKRKRGHKVAEILRASGLLQ